MNVKKFNTLGENILHAYIVTCIHLLTYIHTLTSKKHEVFKALFYIPEKFIHAWHVKQGMATPLVGNCFYMLTCPAYDAYVAMYVRIYMHTSTHYWVNVHTCLFKSKHTRKFQGSKSAAFHFTPFKHA